MTDQFCKILSFKKYIVRSYIAVISQSCHIAIFVIFHSSFRWIDCFINPLLVFGISSIISLSENFNAFFLLVSDDASLQNTLIDSLRLSFSLCPPVQVGEETTGGWEDVRERCCGSTGFFLLRDYKGWILYEAAEEWHLLSLCLGTVTKS